MKVKRQMTAKVEVSGEAPKTLDGEIDVESITIRIGLHEVRVESTKEGMELSYVTKPGRKPARVSFQSSESSTKMVLSQ